MPSRADFQKVRATQNSKILKDPNHIKCYINKQLALIDQLLNEYDPKQEGIKCLDNNITLDIIETICILKKYNEYNEMIESSFEEILNKHKTCIKEFLFKGYMDTWFNNNNNILEE